MTYRRREKSLQQGDRAVKDHTSLPTSIGAGPELRLVEQRRVHAKVRRRGLVQVDRPHVRTKLALLDLLILRERPSGSIRAISAAYLAQRSDRRRRSGVRLGILVESLAIAMAGDEDDSEDVGRRHD